MIRAKIGNKVEYIFVDFFDTVMFREIHSCHMHDIWGGELKKQFPTLKGVDLVKLRMNSVNQIKKWECEIKYHDLISIIQKELLGNGISINEEEFYNKSLGVEIAIEQFVQYPNKEMVDFLYNQKQQGRKIFLVTDFYLPTESYRHFLSLYGIYDLFDEIVCSSDYECSKRSGALYKAIMDKFKINPNKIFMIGDGLESDFENPRNFGINSYRYFPLLHKIKTNIRKNKVKSYCYNIDNLYNHLYKYTNFAEYGFNIFYAMKKLCKKLSDKNIGQIAFLSRGGYFLQPCFDLIQRKCFDINIKSVYLMNSRKVNNDARNNIKNAELMRKYFEKMGFGSPMYLMDEGWYCSAQITFSELYNWTTYGYYLGVMEQVNAPENCFREGLLFNVDKNGNRSPMFGVFRSNCTFYEQILTAPHGSVSDYIDEGDIVGVKQKVIDVEEQIYRNNTLKLQQQMYEVVNILSTFNIDLSLYWLAAKNLKTLLIANDNRLAILRRYNKAYYNNFTNNSVKGISKYSISLLHMIIHPEDYVRFFCKVKEIKSENWMFRCLYKPLGLIIYFYCRTVLLLRYRKIK